MTPKTYSMLPIGALLSNDRTKQNAIVVGKNKSVLENTNNVVLLPTPSNLDDWYLSSIS